MKRYSMLLCLLILGPLFIADHILAEDHKSTNLEKSKARKISSQKEQDAKTTYKENPHKTKNRSKRHQPQELYQIELERQLQQRQMDFELELDQREQEMHMERERREAEHRLRMETMQMQHDREIEMADRNFNGMGHRFLHFDFGLDLDIERLHEILTEDSREKVELLHLRLEQEKIKIIAGIRIQEIEIQISLRKAFLGSEPVDQETLADQVSTIAKSHGELQFLELKTMLEIKDLLSEEQIQQLRYREEDHDGENHDQ